MNVELTMQDMFDNYPTLFKERADCLNHLFCTIGNGYDWVDGELVYGGHCCVAPYHDPEDLEYIQLLESHLVNGSAFQHNKLSLRGELLYYIEQDEKNGIDRYERFREHFKDGMSREKWDEHEKRILEKTPDDVYYKHPRYKRWYFYINIPGREEIDYHYDFSYLWNYPVDIKPDWEQALEECKVLLREDGFEV